MKSRTLEMRTVVLEEEDYIVIADTMKTGLGKGRS
jgi:hypothetical protein